MKYLFPKGSTSVIVPVFIQDSSSTTGAGLGSLDQTSSIVGGYVRPGGTGVALAVDENVTTEGTYQAPSVVGKVRIGTPANMRTGTYELHLHNDLLAAGADAVLITLGGATNMADLIIEIQLTDVDVNDGVRMGMTALPNAAADAAGGVLISDAGGLDMDALNTAAVRLTAARAQVLDDWIDAGRLDAILDTIAGDVVNIDGAAMRGTDSAALASVCTEARLGRLDGGMAGYADGAVWVDTNASNTNTVDHVDGVADNPVSTWAAALTLSASLGITKFHIANGSTITLTGNSDSYSLVGINWTLALGSQSIAGAVFYGAMVTGVGTGMGPRFYSCILMEGGSLTVANALMEQCILRAGGDFICSGTGPYYFINCSSGIAGTSTPAIDYGAAVGSTNVNFRHYSGGIEIKNMGGTGTDLMSLEGHGQLVINVNCSAGTVAIRGHFMITDNAGGAVTLSDDARYGIDQETGLTALTSGTAQSGTASTIVLAAAAAFADNILNGNSIKITGGTGAGQARVIISNTLADDTCNVTPNWITNPSSDSVYEIVDGSVNVDAWRRAILAVPSIGGVPEVDVTHINGDSPSATNLSLDYDGTGYNKANSTVGTCTTNTDMVGTDSAALASVCTEARLAELDAGNLPADVDAILADTNELQTDDVPGLIAALNDLSAANVNTEVADVLKTDTVTEQSQGAPPAAPTMEQIFSYLYMFFRNKVTQTATLQTLLADDGSTAVCKATVSDDATTATKAEFISGA